MVGTSETPYDLRFRLLDIPVRVHPLFWLVTVCMAGGWQSHNLSAVVIWVACVFVSILVHEYGHGLVAKAFDGSPSIVLWGLGGLCFSRPERETPARRLAITLAGPGAGFVLCALVMLAYTVTCGITPGEHLQVVACYLGLARELPIVGKFPTAAMARIYLYLVEINLLWSLLNLLPIWPLDGGRVSEVILCHFDRFRGTRKGHVVSLLVAGALAVAMWPLTNDLLLTIFFAMLAVINYQVLQSLHHAEAMGLYQDDEWWRR